MEKKQNALRYAPYHGTRIAYVGEAGFEYLISLFVSSDLLVYILKNFVQDAALNGIISNIATFSIAAQMMALFFAGRMVKKVVTAGHIINQSCFVLLYFLPAIPLDAGVKTGLFIALLLVGHLLNNIINAPKIGWLMRSVPDNYRGTFTAIKEMVSLITGMALSLGLGFYAQYMEDNGKIGIYYYVCGIALIVLTLLHTLTLILSKEPPLPDYVHPMKVKESVKQLLTVPSIAKVMAVTIFWHIATGFSVSFFAYYKQEVLGFGISEVMIMTVIACGCRFLVSPFIGKLSDRISFSRTMAICLSVAALAFGLNMFVVPETKWMFLAYLCLYNMAMGGINSGFINLIYDFVPLEARQTAMGLQNAFGGLLGFVACVISGILLTAINQAGGFPFFGITLYGEQVLTAITFVCILALLAYVQFVIFPLQKKKEAEKRAAAVAEEAK